jgi:hypothetical protein
LLCCCCGWLFAVLRSGIAGIEVRGYRGIGEIPGATSGILINSIDLNCKGSFCRVRRKAINP